jgi:HK97 gp10 family phage protein
MSVTLKIEGLDKLNAALKEFPENIARNVLRGGVSSAAAVIRNEARRLAPKESGEMAKDIMLKRERSSTNYVANYSVFVRSGKKSRLSGKRRDVDKDSYYWRFVEFGTCKMAAKPFMRPAFDAMAREAVETLKNYIADRIPVEVAKLAK